jgi:hypothetical protein
MKRTVLSVATLVAVGFVGSAQAVNLVNETNSATPTSGELQPGSSSYVNTSGGTTYGLSRGVQILRESTSAQQFQAYCIDPRTTANFSYEYATTDLNTFFTGGAGGYASSAYHNQLNNGKYANLLSGGKDNLAGGTAVRNNLNELFSYAYADSLQSDTNATAFGLAVWEIIMQDGSSATSGFSATTNQFRAKGSTNALDNDAIESRFNTYLSALNAANEAGGWSNIGLGSKSNYSYTVYYTSAPSFGQNFIRANPTGSVPVPGSLALAGIALIGMVRVRRSKA